jgi:nitrite reductase/ring-hydroxylating ferredoxin subunit
MSTTDARRPRAYEAVESLGRIEALDAPASTVSGWVRNAIPKGPVKDAVSGTWLGHALHPLLTDLPNGLWISAVALDLVGGKDAQAAADRLVGLGLGSTLPAIVTGANDWADTTVGNATVRRVGLVHALANVAATTLFAGSLAARRRGSRGTGKLLALAGAGMVGFSGHLGGHLSFAEAVGADQTVFEAAVDDWTDVLAEDEVADGRPHCVEVAGSPVLVMRDRGELVALSDRCAHRGGSLHEGEVEDGCVICPLHGSRFRLRDGSVELGPSAYPQPVWEVRANAGRIEVRRPAEE